MEMLIFFSTRTSKWFANRDTAVLDWPANSPDLKPCEQCMGYPSNLGFLAKGASD